jgi:hypothetical protein
MKNIIKISSGILLGLTMIFTACKKEEVFPPYVDPNNSENGDSTLNITTDTVYAPAGDGESRTFFNAKTQTVITEKAGTANPASTADVIFAYIYNNDSLGAELANTYAYGLTPLTGWTRTATIFRKNVPASTFDNAFYKRAILDAWANATPYTGANEGGYIAPLAVGEVYAFETEAGKHGLIKILTIVPGQDPYNHYLTFKVKTEK